MATTPRASQAALILLVCALAACSEPSSSTPPEPDRTVASMVVAWGRDPMGSVGEYTRESLIVAARNAAGQPVPGVELTALASHGGSVSALRPSGTGTGTVTNHQGYGTFLWKLGWTEGEQTLTVSTAGAPDLVIRAHAYPPRVKSLTLTLVDTILPVGGSTLAYVTLMTTVDTAVVYDNVTWHSNPAIATVTGGALPNQENGASAYGKGPITVTAVSPGRVQISASYHSVSSVIGSASLTVRAVCNLGSATPLAVNQTVKGLATEQDCRLDTGAPYDAYRLTLPVGQRVQVDLASASYDPYLILLDANGKWLTGDDWSGGGTTARITFAAEATTYYLQATSLAPGVTGNYTISTKSVP